MKYSKKFIEYIIEEVLKKIETNSQVESSGPKDKILAISFSNREFFKFVDKGKFQIFYLEDIEEKIMIDEYKYIFIGELRINELVNIAIGLGSEIVSNTVISAILENKKIYAIKEGIEYKKYKETSNMNFYNMIENYEERIKSFGVAFVDSRNAKEILLGKSKKNKVEKSASQKNSNSTYYVKEAVITESLAKKIFFKGCRDIILNKSTIITPLAEDYLRLNGISTEVK